MAQSISNVRYKPSDAHEQAKWAAALSKKTLLLRGSDWTQLADMQLQLSEESKQAWSDWRELVRSVRQSDFDRPEKLDEALNLLVARMPSSALDNVEKAPQTGPKLPEDFEKAKRAALRMVTKTASSIMEDLAAQYGISLPIASEKLEQAISCSVRPHALDKSPLIKTEVDHRKCSAREVVEETTIAYSKWLCDVSVVEAVASQCRSVIALIENHEVLVLSLRSALDELEQLRNHLT